MAIKIDDPLLLRNHTLMQETKTKSQKKRIEKITIVVVLIFAFVTPLRK